MPKDLDQIAAAAAEDVKIAGMRIALEALLNRQRQALHAKELGFIHPKTRKQVHFESELPDDMNAVIEKWRKYIGHKEN